MGFQLRSWTSVSLDWKKFDGSGDSKSTAKAEEKKSESFQVQVSVADLRIRKEPSTSAPSAGMIAKGTHTITETVEADGHTWGKLESGQGWIALEFTTRVDGNAESAPAPAKTSTEMNLDEIKAGNFSSVAGVWKNKYGTSIEFDAQGIVKVNGSALNGVQFSEFLLQRRQFTRSLVACLAQRTKRLFFSFLQEKVAVNPFTGVRVMLRMETICTTV